MKILPFLSVLLFSGAIFSVQAQYEKDYSPLDTVSNREEGIILDIKKRLDTDLSGLSGKKYKTELKNVYKDRADQLIEQVKKHNYIYDSKITGYLKKVLDQIITNNTIKHKPKELLISRSPGVNAFCTGEGILVVNIGLLRRITNESQLAFVIAHEIAHYELDHVNDLIKDRIDLFEGKTTKRRLQETSNGSPQQVAKALDLLKELIYEGSRHGRQDESQADSLGMVFLSKTSYATEEAYTLLHLLDSADLPKYKNGTNLKSVFDFSRFPFKEKWLEEEYSAFGNAKGGNNALFNTDSIKSHPDIEERIAYLKALNIGQEGKGAKNIQPNTELLHMGKALDFEAIQSTYRSKQYDKSLYMALQLLHKYPENDYIKTIIPTILVDLFFARKNHQFGKYVPHASITYHDELQEINTFLHRLRMSEIGQLAFHFLNQGKYFNKENEKHYYLLWKISQSLGEGLVEENVKTAYQSTFPNGKYKQTIK